MVIVSSCLIGKKCRFDGTDKYNEKVVEYLKDKKYIDVCPEELGGLTTPREPVEIKSGKVLTKKGVDCTKELEKGAKISCEIARKNNCKIAIMKCKSPSCGCNEVYDGTHEGHLIPGDGMTTKLLKKDGIKVMTENDL